MVPLHVEVNATNYFTNFEQINEYNAEATRNSSAKTNIPSVRWRYLSGQLQPLDGTTCASPFRRRKSVCLCTGPGTYACDSHAQRRICFSPALVINASFQSPRYSDNG